jgi:DNA-binding CsgD family transcriptional regulator
MSTPRKKKSSRKDPQQTTKYSYILGDNLHLVNRTNLDAEENRSNNAYPLTGGRRSTDKVAFDLYHCWESLSAREKDVTILVCKGLTDAQIATWLKLSVSTVKSYLQHIFLKADVGNRRELLIKFVNFNFPQDPPYR